MTTLSEIPATTSTTGAPRRLRRLGVIGAGTMGAGIAALAASAGIPVELLDIPGHTERDEVAHAGLARAITAKPAAFMDKAAIGRVTVGNTEDHLDRLAACDWVIEAIIENAEAKRALYERLEGALRDDAVVATNTSSIRIETLLEGRSDGFRRRFLGTHFFNPPRYLHLLELIPAPETDAAVVAFVRDVGERILGKGTVLAKDTPGFIANRLGIFGIVTAIWLMEELGLGVDDVDALTGELIGRPRSATFRTADLTGIDVLAAVSAELQAGTGEDFTLPDWIHGLIRDGKLGEKTKAGFFRRADDGEILAYDRVTGDYRTRNRLDLPELRTLRERPLAERIAGARALAEPYGEFVRRLLDATAEYAARLAPDIAHDPVDVDRAMQWGYGWEQGPLGIDDTAPRAGVLALRGVRDAGGILDQSADTTLLDLGDGVALIEFHTKMNAIGDGVLRGLQQALERIEREGLAGLVIGNEDVRAFSAGANLGLIAMLAQEGEFDEIDIAVRRFQRATTSLRAAPFPVVCAPAGLALGGGCELALHSDRVQAHAELYMGLVEVGVGLIPAGGGTKELLVRFMADLAPYVEADPFEAVRRAFMVIGLAQTSTSAYEARGLGFLRDRDRITMNRDHLLADAKARVLDLAPGYVAPSPPTVQVLGSQAIGNLRYAAFDLKEAGRISAHDARIAEELAAILAGGEGPPRVATEQELLDLERQSFMRLLGTRPTRERIAHMLKTGKPLRN
jgi:3-hydroxyacyl-CoA dehydrogenase